MAKKSNSITFHLNLEKVEPNFYRNLMSSLEEELEIAQQKWKLKLTESSRQNVIDKSLEQLMLKVSSVAHSQWDMSNNIDVQVGGNKQGELWLPDPSLDDKELYLMRTREGWRIDNEFKEDGVKLRDFSKTFHKDIIRWGRTAVFYGVGSYA